MTVHRPNRRVALAIRFSLAIAIATLGAHLVQAPSALSQEQRLQITSVVTDNWPAVEVTVTVVDSAGQPIAGLSPVNFGANADAAVLPITGVSTTSDPSVGIAVVLAFDVSGSMAGEPLAQAKAAGKALLAQLGPTDQVAVLAFANQPTLVQSFTSDKAAVEAAVGALVEGGDTALYAAVEQSAEAVQQAPLARRAVVLLSDGVDFGVLTTATRESSLSLAAQSGTTFMTIGLGADIDSQYLEELAAPGGGQFLLAPTPGDLESSYQTAAAILRQQYVLTLDASGLANFATGTLRIAADLDGVSAAAETALSPPPAFAAASTSGPTFVPVETPGSVTAIGESSGPPAAAVAGVVAAATVLAGAGAMLWFRRRRAGAVEQEQFEPARFEREPAAGDFPAIERAVPDTDSGAWLELPEGRRHQLGSQPMTIGFSTDCSVNLQNGVVGGLERVRIWRREGRYMLHNLSQFASITVGGRTISWVILEDGDVITLGALSVTFHDPSRAAGTEI